jgi:hypothetical protein
MNGWYEAALTAIAVKSDHLRHRYLLYVTNNSGLKLFFIALFRIHDILVWIRIRIRGSMSLTNGSGFGCGSGFCYFRH